MHPENPIEPSTPQEQQPVKKSSISLPAAIVSAAAVIAIAIVFTFGPKGAPTPTPTSGDTEPTTVPTDVATVRSTDYIRGSATANVVVIEYSDSDCPYCQQFHKTMQQAMQTYGNKLAWVYRFFPLSSLHPNAETEALSLSCVGELGGSSAFWPYLDTIIGVTLTPDASSNQALATFASAQGISTNLFTTCMKANDTARIEADSAEAQKIGARGTPFSVAVNTKTGKQAIIPGALPYDAVKTIIDGLLK